MAENMYRIYVKVLSGLVVWSLLGLSAPTFAAPPPAANSAADVINVRFSGDEEQTRIVIETREVLDYRWFVLAQNGLRLVVDMPVVHWTGATSTKPTLTGKGDGHGAVVGYRFGKYSPTTSRLVFDLKDAMQVKKDFYLAPGVDGAPHRLVLDLTKTDPISFASEAGFSEPFTPRPIGKAALRSAVKSGGVSYTNDETAASRKPKRSNRSSKRIIVIDAGHGGKDPGSLGSRSHEKNINLRAAIELKKVLEKSGKYTVRLTRSKDVFIELVDRVEYARKQEADLLISLHSDSAANKKARGASVYTLIEWASRRAKGEVMRGDSSIIGVDVASARPGVDDILLNLSQRQTQNESAILAEILTSRLARISPMVGNPHRDKNLFVLLAPDVPSVLVEMGFLSNKQDEANLGSIRHMRKLMGAVGGSVDEYFARSERLHASR